MGGADFNQVHHIVRQVPHGKVVSYGQIAFWLGWPHGARTDEQRIRLEIEGVVFDPTGRIDLKLFQWQGQPHLLGT